MKKKTKVKKPKTIFHALGDKWTINGIPSQTVYTNIGWGFIAPEKDTLGDKGQMHYSCLVFAIINEFGIERDGKQVARAT